MSDYLIMKAVEHDKLPVKFKKQYPDTNALLAAGWWVQDKYDGCMGIAMMTSDLDKCRMLSRTGEDYTMSCQAILAELHGAATDQSGSWDDFIVIGEVWVPIEEAKFPAISGRFRKQKLDDKLRFICNDILPPDFNTPMPYRERFADLCELLPNNGDWKCSVAKTIQAYPTNAERYALTLQSEGGYDGAILRDPDAGYTVGTVKAGEIVKVKPVMSLDLLVTERRVGYGEKTGREVYTITVAYNGVASDVGSGMPQSRDALPQIGDIAEIECLGITEDGKLREPRFKGIRHDKVKPD